MQKSKPRQTEITWKPFPDSPQEQAYYSKADVLGYGGSGGGGKTDLLLGLAATAHYKAVIFRRLYTNLGAIIERSREIMADASGVKLNEQFHRWRREGRGPLEFEACQQESDKFKQRGHDRDFYGFDELTEFTKSQFQFITAWNRSAVPGQRCRIVVTFNPPTDDEGGWVVDYFLPWLSYLHPETFHHENPAAPGELRWYTTIDGDETPVPDGRPFVLVNNEIVYDFDPEKFKPSEIVTPQSRTFIPAKLEDNPILSATNYRSTLQMLPEPLRSQLLKGDFSATGDDDIWQVISAASWDRAVERWKARNLPSTAPLTRAGLDVARGGKDFTVKAPIHADGYCGELVKVPGTMTKTGRDVAQLIYLQHNRGDITVAVDVIGVGSSPVDVLTEEGFTAIPFNSSGKATVRINGKDVPWEDPSSHMRAVNLRSAAVWNLKLLLEKDLIDLPPDPRLRRAALAHRWRPVSGGIRVLEKDQVKELIGYSPDEFDAVCMGYWIPVPRRRRTFAEIAKIYQQA